MLESQIIGRHEWLQACCRQSKSGIAIYHGNNDGSEDFIDFLGQQGLL